jgi:hypothetical protein
MKKVRPCYDTKLLNDGGLGAFSCYAEVSIAATVDHKPNVGDFWNMIGASSCCLEVLKPIVPKRSEACLHMAIVATTKSRLAIFYGRDKRCNKFLESLWQR